jgi:hypothetical protein
MAILHVDRGLGKSEEFSTQRSRSQTATEDSGNPTIDFHGEERRNDTHASTTDPEARLARKKWTP